MHFSRSLPVPFYPHQRRDSMIAFGDRSEHSTNRIEAIQESELYLRKCAATLCYKFHFIEKEMFRIASSKLNMKNDIMTRVLGIALHCWTVNEIDRWMAGSKWNINKHLAYMEWTWTWTGGRRGTGGWEQVSVLARGFQKKGKDTTTTTTNGMSVKKHSKNRENAHINTHWKPHKTDSIILAAKHSHIGMDWSPHYDCLQLLYFHTHTFDELNSDVYFTSFMQCPTRKMWPWKKAISWQANRSNKTGMTYSLLAPARPPSASPPPRGKGSNRKKITRNTLPFSAPKNITHSCIR